MAAADAKISVHSLSDLKNTSDDAIPNYLNSLKFKQSHTLTDVRLALGYTAFAISAATFYWDYKLGFESTKYYTAVAVAIYTALNGFLTLWIWGVEKGKVYIGTSPSGEKIEISSSTKKHVPIYNLTIKCYPSGDSSNPKTITLAKSFTEWFDSAGHFVPLPFQKMFAGGVPIIGAADPMRAAISEDGKVVQSSSSSAVDPPQTANAGVVGNATGNEVNSSPRKSTRSRKKA